MGIQKPSHTLAKIHTKALHTNRFHILLTLSFTVFINTFGFAQVLDGDAKSIEIPKEKEAETSIPSPKAKDSAIISTEALIAIKETDTTENDSIKPKPALLQGIVTYSAKDYTAFNRKEQKMYLYNEARIIYQDMDISAGIIVIDYNKNEVYAGRLKDSAGVYSQRPVFKQGQSVVEPDSIRLILILKKPLFGIQEQSKTEVL